MQHGEVRAEGTEQGTCLSFLCSSPRRPLCFSSPMVKGRGIRRGFMEMVRAADSVQDPKLPAAVGTASGIRPILAADVAAYRVRARFCSEVNGRADKWAPCGSDPVHHIPCAPQVSGPRGPPVSGASAYQGKRELGQDTPESAHFGEFLYSFYFLFFNSFPLFHFIIKFQFQFSNKFKSEF
jgi:hypothetical protein